MIVAAGAAVFALGNTGTMGIEERFQSALGLSEGQGTDGSSETGDVRSNQGESGFSIEGSPVFYFLVLVFLALGCCIVYRKFRI